MSASAETAFSGTPRTITWQRGNFSGELVEQSECLKDWLRRGFDSDASENISEVSDDDSNDPFFSGGGGELAGETTPTTSSAIPRALALLLPRLPNPVTMPRC